MDSFAISQFMSLYFTKIIGAIAILVIGLLLAKYIASGIGKLIEKNPKINEWINKFFGETEREVKFGKIVVKTIYYILMIFVITAVFEALGFTILTEPLNKFLGNISSFIPQIIGAVMLLAAAWILARIVKFFVLKGLALVKFDEKMAVEEGRAPLSQAIAEIAYWFVFLIFLPGILSALSLGGILQPVQNMLNKILSVLPNLIGAGLIIAIGWFIAGKIREASAQILRSVGIDRIGKEEAEEKNRLSEIIANIVYVLILIPVLVAGLDMIGLSAVTRPATNMLDRVLGFIPNLFSAFVIIYVAYFIGRLLGDLVSRVLGKMGIEKLLADMGLITPEGAKTTISAMAGNFVKIAVVFFAALEAANILGLNMLAGLVDQFIVLVGHIILGLVIIGVGLYIAQLVASVISSKKSASSDMLSAIARISIIVLAIAMGLRQMGIANEIINMAFGFTIGAVAVAAAIAFGIGGKEIAAKALAKLEKKSEE